MEKKDGAYFKKLAHNLMFDLSEEETFFIREDEVSNVISQKEALANAPKMKQGHFAVPKVVK